MTCGCRGHPPAETDAHRSTVHCSKCSHRRSPPMRAFVFILLACTSFHSGQSLRTASPGAGLRLVNYSGSPCCTSSSPCSVSSRVQEPEHSNVASCRSLSFSDIRAVGCPPLWAPSPPGPSASRLHDILGSRRRQPYTTCLLRGGFSADPEGPVGLGSFQDTLKRECGLNHEPNKLPILRMSLGSGNAEREDKRANNAADQPMSIQEADRERSRARRAAGRSLSAGAKKVDAHQQIFPAVRTNGTRRNTTKGYTSLVALKQAIDITAGWRSPDLSVQEAAKRRAAGPKDWTATSEPAWRKPALQAKPARQAPDVNGTQAAAEGGGAVSEDSSDDDSDDVDSVLDLQRTLINIGIFLSTIAGWKGLWDIQDKYLTSYWSLAIGALLYFLRVKVDDVLDTHDVHEEDWYDLFEKLPELSLFSAESLSAYGRIYLSSGLVFCSSLFIWRGLWQALDDINVVGSVCIVLSAISFIALSLTQLSLERKRLNDPNGARSPSVYDNDELFTMGRPHFYPEEFQSSSEDSNESDDKDEDVKRTGSAEGRKGRARSVSAEGKKQEGGEGEGEGRSGLENNDEEGILTSIRPFGTGGANAFTEEERGERSRRVVD